MPRTAYLPRPRPVGGCLVLLVSGTLLVCLPWLAYLLAKPVEEVYIDEQGRRARVVFEGQAAFYTMAIVGTILGGGSLLAGVAMFCAWLARVRDDLSQMAEGSELSQPGLTVGLLFVPLVGPVWMYLCLSRFASLAAELYRERAARRSRVRQPGNPAAWLIPAAALGLLYLPVTGVLILMVREDPAFMPLASLLWFGLPPVVCVLLAGAVGVVKRNLDLAIGHWRARQAASTNAATAT